jgi:putative oxidoreductase
MAKSSSSRSTWGLFLLRFIVGWVFLSEGVQKFLYPAALGVGRFAKIGIPYPHLSAPFVGVVEIVCGALLILGVRTSTVAVPLLIDISVAIVTTKWPMLRHQGFWPAMHESRVDLCMFFGLVSILLMGPGSLSVDSSR